MTNTIDLHKQSLTLIEGKRLCDVKTAARYMGRSEQAVYRLLKAQKIASVYDGPQRRLVVVADLIRYVDDLPIDREEEQ